VRDLLNERQITSNISLHSFSVQNAARRSRITGEKEISIDMYIPFYSVP